MNLKYSDCEVKFVEESNEKSFDIIAKYKGEEIAIECKNKQIEDENYKRNQAFGVFFAQQLSDRLKELKGKLDIRITVKNVGRIEDVKPLSLLIKEMISKNIKKDVLGNNYEVEFIEDYKNVPTPLITAAKMEDLCINRTEVTDLKNAFYNQGTEFKDRIFFRFPPENETVKNIDSLISEANKQIKDIQGCVFIRVPFFSFEQSIVEVERLLHKGYENLGAIKVVALNKTLDRIYGVKTERQEKWIVNPNAKIPISAELAKCLSQNIFLNKYKDFLKYRTTSRKE